MRGYGSEGWGGVVDAEECDETCMNVKMMCWNVTGWARGDVSEGIRTVEEHDMRAKVINFYEPDVVCLVET